MSAPATAAFKTLFRNAHNVPLKCFVQFDASNEQVLEVKSLLQNHGADVSSYLQHALVILVDPPTTGGQLLIQEFANDQTRAILDFGWVKDCIRQGRCLGPAENWGGHRLPVTNVNDFFSFSGPPSSSSAGPPSAVSQASYAGNVGPYPLSPSVSTYQSQASTPGPLPIRASVPILAPAPAVGANALPSPAVSHPLPPSPISSTQRERSESKLELSIGDKRADPDPSASFVTATARRDEDVKTSQPLSTIDGVPQTPDGEPAPPDPSKMVLHHNGMGAKFTDDDIEYIRNYFIWSTKHFPNRTRGQVLEKIHEKMPYHSVVSVTQFMRRHPVYFAEFRKNDPVATLTAAVKAEKVAAAAAKTKEYPQEVPYDPGNADNEEPPKPPTNLIPFAKGYRFTTADDQFIIAYFNWHGKRFPGATKGMVLRDLAKWAPYRSLPSWTTYLSKHIHEWKKLIPLLENDMSEDEEQASSHGFEEEDSTFKPEPVAGMPDPGASSSSAAPEAHDADARRWNPPRRSSLTKPSLAPGVQPDDGDTSYDDRSAPPVSSASSRKQRSPRTSRLPQQMTVEHKQPKERRRSLAFTPQERQNFIEFLADHPWVWTSVAVPAEWLIGATTASAVWAKYQAMYPHRSDASWREYHKRNAVEFDPEAKRLRLMRLGLASAGSNIAPTSLTSLAPLIPPTEDLSDQEFDGVESEDGHDGVPFIPNQDELPASSFSYHPLPPAHESEDEEEDQLRTDEDEDMPSASNEPSTRGGSPDYGAGKKGSRKGRAYLPFSQEQKERFMDFLVQNPQVWAHATPNPAWVSWELQHQGKDSTWKILAAMPGMDNHSYKSWREYHRARAEKVDPEAKRRRLALEATRPSLAPSVSMESESSRKRSRSVESDMDIGTSPPPEPKRSKLDELDESMTMRSEA